MGYPTVKNINKVGLFGNNINLLITSVTSGHHPVLRIFLKLLKEVVFAAKDSHKVSQHAIFVLYRVLSPVRDFKMSVPMCIIEYFEHVIKNRTHAMCCGGLITHLATRFGIEDHRSRATPLNIESTTITLKHTASLFKLADVQPYK